MEVQAGDLAEFPGAPFTQSIVDAVVTRLERELGWHVAPVKTETLRARMPAGAARDQLLLPSRHVTGVTAVRKANGAPILGWTLTGASEAILEGCWGPGWYDVDATHGYEKVPADLLAAIAAACVQERTDPSISSWTSGPFSASLRAGGAPAAAATLLAYTVSGVV